MNRFFTLFLIIFIGLFQIVGFGQDSLFPQPMDPPRLVNDFANVMSPSELSALENKVLNYNNTSSIEISVVTVQSMHGYEVADYTIKLANKWKIGKKEKNNGVLVLASIDERKMFIASGYGMEGVLTDAQSGMIYRNEMTPYFRQGKYYEGFDKAVDAIVAVSKGEYTADATDAREEGGSGGFLLIMVIVIIILLFARKGGKGGGNGTYMSRRGSDIVIGSILGDMMRGGSSGGGFGGGGGGFGGFGGGSFGGGGAGGSW